MSDKKVNNGSQNQSGKQKKLGSTTLVNSKFITAQQQQKQKPKASDKQRYLCSPEFQNQIDFQKNAWERLLERSFDPRSVELIKQQKKKLDEKKDNRMESHGIKSNKGHSNWHSPRQETCDDLKDTLSHAFQSQRVSQQNSKCYKNDDKNESQIFKSPNTEPVWKKFFEKTSNDKVIKTDSNYSQRRTLENFLSGRTINPTQYASQANVLLINEESYRTKAMKRCETNREFVSEITGQTRKMSVQHNKHLFKYQYDQEELDQFAQSNTSPLKQNFARERSHSKLRSMVPNEEAVPYLGGSKIKTLIYDRALDGIVENETTRIKNQKDYKSRIACLSSQASDHESQERQTSQVRRLKHLLTSYENGAADIDTLRSRRRIQQPYHSKNLTNHFHSGVADIGQEPFQRERREKSARRPQGVRNAFESQIGSFS